MASPAEIERSWTVVDVAEPDVHVVEDGCGNGDGDADAEDGMGDGERIDVARANEDETGRQSPDQREGCEDRVGQMRERKDDSTEGRGNVGVGENAQQARKKISLQQ